MHRAKFRIRVIRGYNDTDHANASSHRGVPGEASTTILRYLNGQTYQISIPGEIKFSGSGRR